MEKRTKTSHKVYMAWDYDREIRDLNKASQEGWQLTQGGCFYSTFEYNPDIVYRYQLDYNTDKQDRERYLETFTEQGWEYINSTYNGWHYFKKQYDRKLPDGEYEIYTDRSMVPDLIARWLRLASVLAVVLGMLTAVSLYGFIKNPEFLRGVQLLMCLDITMMIAWGCSSFQAVRKGREKRMPSGAAAVFLGIYLICILLMIFL